jgi:hypothetical protein
MLGRSKDNLTTAGDQLFRALVTGLAGTLPLAKVEPARLSKLFANHRSTEAS